MKKLDNFFKYPDSNNEKNSHNTHLNPPIKNQIEFENSCLDDLIPDDHQVRNIWSYVDQMDLSLLSQKIQSTFNRPDQSTIDPKIMLALWIYALVEGIGCAKMISRYCNQYLAFKWICRGVSVNYQSISDFWENNCKEINQLVIQSIARLMERDLVTLKRVSSDGMKINTSFLSSSLRRKPTRKELLAVAKEQMESCCKDIDADRAGSLDIQMAEERKTRMVKAIEEHQKLIKDRDSRSNP